MGPGTCARRCTDIHMQYLINLRCSSVIRIISKLLVMA